MSIDDCTCYKLIQTKKLENDLLQLKKMRKYYQTHHIPFFSKFSNFYEKKVFFRPQFEMPRNYFK